MHQVGDQPRSLLHVLALPGIPSSVGFYSVPSTHVRRSVKTLPLFWSQTGPPEVHRLSDEDCGRPSTTLMELKKSRSVVFKILTFDEVMFLF